MTREEFLSWESHSQDTIDVKRIYCDMASELVGGVMFSQIVFWHLPDKSGQPKLRAEKDGFLWLAKNHGHWWDECRVSALQAARALKKMKKDKLIIMENSMFDAKKTPFIRVNWGVFLKRFNELLAVDATITLREKTGSVVPVWPPDCDETSKSVSTKRRNRSYRKVETDNDETSRPITESTSQITSESTPETPPSTVPPRGDSVLTSAGAEDSHRAMTFKAFSQQRDEEERRKRISAAKKKWDRDARELARREQEERAALMAKAE